MNPLSLSLTLFILLTILPIGNANSVLDERQLWDTRENENISSLTTERIPRFPCQPETLVQNQRDYKHSTTDYNNCTTSSSRNQELKYLYMEMPSASSFHGGNVGVRLERSVPLHSNLLDSSSELQYHILLINLVLFIIQTQMLSCDLLIAYDEAFSHPRITEQLSMVPNTKQMIYMQSPNDLTSVLWTSNLCRGFVFLVSTSHDFITFANEDLDSWDYHGRYMFAGLSLGSFKEVVGSKKGKKTENIIGVVQSGIPSEWQIYMNRLFSGNSVQRINTWKNGKFTTQADLFPDKVTNLQRSELKITTFKWEPEVMYYKDSKGELLYRYGIDIEVVNTLKKAMNFTPVYQEPPGGQLWGDKLENGSWTGMMGMISRDETDMCFPLYITITRLGILDYTSPYKLQKSCFMVKTEPPLPRWQALSYPFHQWTWISIFIGFLISGPLLFLFALGTRQNGEEIAAFRTLISSCHYTLGLHLNEPQENLPKRPSTQIYIIFLWLYCFILTIAYTTNLTSFLTVKKAPKRMETMRDLHESGLAVTAASWFYKDTFIASPDKILHELAKKYQVEDEQDEIIRQIREGIASYPENEGYLEFIIATKLTQRGLPQARILEECYASHSAAMALQNYSPLKRRFDQVIDGMTSGGLIRRYLLKTLRIAKSTKEYGASEESADTEDSEESLGTLVPLSLDHMQSIFFVLIIGWGLSAVTFVGESMR